MSHNAESTANSDKLYMHTQFAISFIFATLDTRLCCWNYKIFVKKVRIEKYKRKC